MTPELMAGPQDSRPKLAENVMGALRPHPEYKASGLPWLGEIPAHWQEKRAKYFFREVDERSTTGDEELLSVSHVTGVTPRSQKNVTMFMAESYVGHKLCRPADLVINTMWAWMSALGVAKQPGIVSPAYAVYRPIAPGAFSPEFVDHLLRTQAYASEYWCRSTGIRASRLRLYPEGFLEIPIACPPQPEQDQILVYLKAKDQQIRRFIGAKRRLIELLNEQKQAIIHRAVTRGLDPSVRLKPSGIDWLGDVPEHWAVAPLRRFAISRCDGPFGSGLKTSHYTTHGVRVIRLQNIGHSEFRDADAAYISPEHCASLGDHDVRRNDLLVAGLGDGLIPAGRACVAPDNVEPAMVKADCFRFRLRASLAMPQFIAFQLSATAGGASAILSSGATRQRINLQGASGRAIAVPPLAEQEEIVSHLTSALRTLQSGVLRVGLEIELLGEYRTRLIADVVTGKLDVRGVEVPALDEGEAVDEASLGGEEAGEADPDAATEDAAGSREE